MHRFLMRYTELSVVERFSIFKEFVIRGSTVCTVEPPNKGHFWGQHTFSLFCSL